MTAAITTESTEPNWDDKGLLPAIVQDEVSGTILMMAWMNREAWQATKTSGIAHFWSRSRAQLWRKGETSGNQINVSQMYLDCDRDCILMLATATGPACHTGVETCFYTPVEMGRTSLANRQNAANPQSARPLLAVLADLEKTIASRKSDGAEKSYTKALFASGAVKIAAKLREEANELADEFSDELIENADIETTVSNHDKIVYETGDVLYHMLVGLSHTGVAFADVAAELRRRFHQSGLAEKASRGAEPSL